MGKAKSTSDKKAVALKVKPGKKTDPKTKNKVTGFKIGKKGKNDAETVDLIKQIKNATSKKVQVQKTDDKPKADKQKKQKAKKPAKSETPAAADEAQTEVKSTLTLESILPESKTVSLVQSLIDATKKEAEKKKDIFGSDYKYKVQVTAIKIPKCPERVARM